MEVLAIGICYRWYATRIYLLAIRRLLIIRGFKKPVNNRLFAIFANFPMAFRMERDLDNHVVHHKFMGKEGYDTDMPTKLEAMILSSVAGKAFFATFQIFFYALRPVCVMKIEFT